MSEWTIQADESPLTELVGKEKAVCVVTLTMSVPTNVVLSDLAATNSGQSDCSVSMANLSPLASPANLLQQTEDQIPSGLEGPFVNLLPPLLQEDYLLSLGEEEGISDLFDAYDLEKLPLVEDFMCS